MIAILALTCITVAGVASLRPWSLARVAKTEPGDVLDFGVVRPARLAPEPPVRDVIADRARLAAEDGRCLGSGLLTTALIAGGWCREPAGPQPTVSGEETGPWVPDQGMSASPGGDGPPLRRLENPLAI